MRFILVAALVLVLFISLIIKGSLGTLLGDFFINYTHSVSKMNDADRKMDEVLKLLKNKKEDLEFLENQIDNLKTGLAAMPDTSQDGYFRNLLTKFLNEESDLYQQIAQLDQEAQETIPALAPNETILAAHSMEEYRKSMQESMQRTTDLMGKSQLRTADQMQIINNLVEQNKLNSEVLIQRINDLLEQRQNRPQVTMRTN